MGRIYATTTPDISKREQENLARSRRIAAEGMVLLENNGILPMELKGRRIALFGNGARHTVQGGTGSGEVNARTSARSNSDWSAQAQRLRQKHGLTNIALLRRRRRKRI